MRILLACGGTGGHIFPAFSVAAELKKRLPSVEIAYVCGRKDIENAIFKVITPEKIFTVESASAAGPFPLLRPSFLIKLTSGFFKSAQSVKKFDPDVVVGFGGYVSFPVVVMGRLLGRRTLIHEQNVVPGLANKVLARIAHRVALSHEVAGKHFGAGKKTRITGNPVRPEIGARSKRESLEFFGFDPVKKTLLVLGGSQGAESINTFFLGALEFLPLAVKERLQVLHLCGRMPPAQAEEVFRRHGVLGKAISFFEKMEYAYGAADVAIGRAGATFLAELALTDMPAILIPYPYGDGHQRFNAEAFSRDHDAVTLEQKGLTPEGLSRHIMERLSCVREVRKTGSSAAAARLTDLILESAAEAKR